MEVGKFGDVALVILPLTSHVGALRDCLLQVSCRSAIGPPLLTSCTIVGVTTSSSSSSPSIIIISDQSDC